MAEQNIAERNMPLRTTRIGTAAMRDAGTDLSVWFETEFGGWGFVLSAEYAERLGRDLIELAAQRRANAKRRMS